MGKSWAIPKFDVYDPSLVFYAPLWRPDMVARGGAIKNGTGTMDVTPQALAVGANTITVTAAGTLIVYMPEGGTVASGTMTVTGSPVTVSAGIATTITTTGAIGNITVTSSNIIRSKDKNNLALTVTGATWGYQGRTFDGDDYISIPDNALFTPISGGAECAISMGGWVKLTDATSSMLMSKFATNQVEWLFRCGDADDKIQFYVSNPTAASSVGRYSAAITAYQGSWIFVFAVYDGGKLTSSTKLYLGTATASVSQVDNADSVAGSYTGVTNGTAPLEIGSRSGGTGELMDGTIGEIWLYHNRALTLATLENMRLVTKWRY